MNWLGSLANDFTVKHPHSKRPPSISGRREKARNMTGWVIDGTAFGFQALGLLHLSSPLTFVTALWWGHYCNHSLWTGKKKKKNQEARGWKRSDLWLTHGHTYSVQFSSVAKSCPTLCDPMDCSTPGLPVHHQFPESTQTHVHRVSDAIQPSHPLSSPFPPALNLSQHQGLFKWVSSSHQVAKVLEFQLHQSFQWTPRTDLL